MVFALIGAENGCEAGDSVGNARAPFSDATSHSTNLTRCGYTDAAHVH